ncbi:hypothetical protein DOY81_005499 [Sarcophaga bullata]|nr:hypothetical protein DOY81_005499 [Sarcophaga bullata]
MGCPYETAIQKNRINEASSTTRLNSTTRNFLLNEGKEHLHNNKLNQHNFGNNITNDYCQQYQKLPTIIKANKTSTVINSWKEKIQKKINFFNSESKEYARSNYSIHLETLHFVKSESVTASEEKDEDTDTVLPGTCINCYPLTCHNRYCCKKQQQLQTHLVVDKIAQHNRRNINNITNGTNCNLNNYDWRISSNPNKVNCSCNNKYCRCHLSFFYPKHTKNTLRNEQQCKPYSCHCNCVATQTNDFSTFADAYSQAGHCLQKTISLARASLTSNALDLKNNLIEVMANCAHLMGIGIGYSNIDTNANNHNKSDPYRGYCQRKHHFNVLNNSKYSSYSNSISSSNSSSPSSSSSTTSTFSIHNAIRSNSSPYNNSNNNSRDINNTFNNKNTTSRNGNRNCNNRRNNKSCTNSNYNCQDSSIHTAAAFNCIGQNYFNFLRNTINFYTASSVILVLCYLTSTTSAATTKSDTTSVDKHPIFDESSSDKEILDLLLEKKRYDKRLLPPVNDEDFCCGLSSPDMATEQNSRRPHRRGTLTVNVNVLLLSLASPDESSLKYEVEFLLNQQWNDPRLQYGNKSHYDFLNALHHHDSIWTPDTYFIMHGDFKDPIIPMHFALRIYRNGTITYAMRRHLILSCQGSLHIFPFDDPKCSFSMESISYEEAQIKYVWKNDEDTLRKSPSLTTLNAYLIKNQTTACDQNSWRGNYSCLQVELTFTRDRAYYFTTVFIPGIILVTSSFITFWLEWNAVPARVMIGVTTMLNFFTTSNGFRSTLPVVSNLTAMNVWDGVCMCFIYASLLEFVCVNYMGRKRPQHNVVYRPGENPVTQFISQQRNSRSGAHEMAKPCNCKNLQRSEIIEREFHAALSSEKAAAGLSSAGTSMGVTPTPATPTSEPLTRVHFYQEPSGGIIATAVQSLRSRSIKRRSISTKQEETIAREEPTQVYEHVYTEPGGITTFAPIPSVTTTTVTIESDVTDNVNEMAKLRRTQSMSTNTPPLISKSQIQTDINGHTQPVEESKHAQVDQMPIRPPRKKSSRSTSPSARYDVLQTDIVGMTKISGTDSSGEKKRDAGGPNEIVACTTCGGSSGSPCTHSANNGCATETCFVQVRKKEPPHPIRIAKTIDVIARITFPTAYAIFLIFFFVHYKGFS